FRSEAVVAVVAQTRAQAEDALELIEIAWTQLPAIASPEAASASGARLVNSTMTGNIGLDHSVSAGDPDRAFRDATVIVEHDFTFWRQTGVTLEPRTIVANFDARLRQLTVHHSHQ